MQTIPRRSERRYTELVARRTQQYGEQFQDTALDPRFIPYYENGQRIKVKEYGETKTGTVGVTTGWVPCFLLMSRSTAYGSSCTLGEAATIIAVKRGKTYHAI